jgi:hypothetical protein
MILFTSKRTTFSLVVLICATIMLAFGRLTGGEWIDLVKLLTTTLVVGHTVSDAIEARTQPAIPAATIVNKDETKVPK